MKVKLRLWNLLERRWCLRNNLRTLYTNLCIFYRSESEDKEENISSLLTEIDAQEAVCTRELEQEVVLNTPQAPHR